jgi:hypothetical protein
MDRIYRIKEMLNDECGTLNIFNSSFSVQRSAFILSILSILFELTYKNTLCLYSFVAHL